jgi:N-acetylglutamate synthase-like GNAT family acetyltransferase
MNFRKAHENESDYLSDLAIRSKSHWPYPEDYLEKSKELLEISPHYIDAHEVIVAEEDDKIIGFYAMEREFVEHFWIDPGYIGKGYGTEMFGNLMTQAREMNLGYLYLYSEPFAIGFYEKMGWGRYGKKPSRIDPGIVFVQMEIEVT